MFGDQSDERGSLEDHPNAVRPCWTVHGDWCAALALSAAGGDMVGETTYLAHTDGLRIEGKGLVTPSCSHTSHMCQIILHVTRWTRAVVHIHTLTMGLGCAHHVMHVQTPLTR